MLTLKERQERYNQIRNYCIQERLTLKEIAKKYKISRSRVHQIYYSKYPIRVITSSNIKPGIFNINIDNKRITLRGSLK